MDTNACLDVVIDSTTTCNPTCEEACWSGYVSVNASGDSTFLNNNGDLVAIIDIAGNIAVRGALFSSGTDAEDTIAAIRVRIQNCIDDCENNIYPDLSPCDIKYNVLKADMSPGGQYFDALGASTVTNGWLIDNIGSFPPECMNGTWDDTRNGWQDSWGDMLVKHHPEWCAYQKECCPILSEGDCAAVTTISTSTGGICDPAFVDSEIATHMADYLGTGYSVLTLFGTTTYPTGGSPALNYPTTSTGNQSLDDLLDLLYNTTDGAISLQKVMTPTQFMNSIRDFHRELVKYNYIKTNCSSQGLYLADVNGKTADGFYVRYPKNLVFESFTLPFVASNTVSTMQSLLPASCSTQAQRATDQFMSAFACKVTLDADTVNLRNTVLLAMYTNCNNNKPVKQGLDAVVIGFLSSNGYPVGCLTGSWFEQEQEHCQCDNLFKFLADANGQPLYEVIVDPSYATNTTSLNALTSILSATDLTNGVSVGDLPAWYSNCNATPFSGIGLTPTPEYFTCTNDSIPVDTNACVTAINELAYRNELARIKAQVLDSVTAYRTRYTNKCFENIKTREVFTMEYLLQEYHYTLYYYDQAGNLIKTVPPEGLYQEDKNGDVVHSSILDATQVSLVDAQRRNPSSTPTFIQPDHLMATNYRYNSLNQLTSQFTPDGDSSHFFYDALGRLVVSQNATQLLNNNYSYTVFDDLGRMVEVGEIQGATSALTETDARDVNDYLNQTASSSNLFHIWMNSNTSNRRQIVNTYYDKQNITILPTTILAQQNLRNRIATVTYDENGDNIHESASHYTYDINGNVNSLLQENNSSSLVTYGEQYKRIDYDYDLVSGNVNKVSYQSGKKDEFYHKYEYDADNRLTVAYTSRNDVIWEKESKNLYYAHGPLARTEIGDKQVQAQDYAYTLQGWLKTINSSMGHQDRDIGQDGISGINENFGRDIYGFSLHYYRGDYQAIDNSTTVSSTIAQYGGGGFNDHVVDLYNGNISAMVVGLTRHDNSKAQVVGNTYRYDQLNRIKEYTPFLGDDIHSDPAYDQNTLDPTQNMNQRYNTLYSYDGNGNIKMLNRRGTEWIQNPANPTDPNDLISVQVEMDDFNYDYQNKNGSGAKTNNQLDHVADDLGLSGNYTDDLDSQDDGNYQYDKIGRLIQDVKEKIDLIVWNVANKITKIVKDGGNQIIEFDYDPMGNRISKANTIPTGVTTTYYVRDAQGNVMTTYKESNITSNQIYELNDFHIYGSSRLGTKQVNKMLFTNGTPNSSLDRSFRKLGEKRYELANHLGNVLQVISDRKISYNNGSGKTGYFEADVVSYSDYYPFGMLMPNRHGQDDNYRYGFNGMESDDEVRGTKGASYDFGARMLDPRIGRWLSTDALEHKYVGLTPYNFVGNSPLVFVDPDGNKIIIVTASGKKVEYKPGIKPTNSDKFLNQFHEAVSYAMKNDVNKTFQNISKSSEVVTVSQITTHDDEATATINSAGTKVENVKIAWNPTVALKTTNGGAITPATALLHEAAHAERYINSDTKAEVDQLKIDLAPDGSVYDNAEEKRVVDNIETPFVKATNLSKLINTDGSTPQKEGTRSDHRGTTYVSKGVTSISRADGKAVKGEKKAPVKKSFVLKPITDETGSAGTGANKHIIK